MENKHLEERIIDLINGRLPDDEKEKLLSQLREFGYDVHGIEELKKLYDAFEDTVIPETSGNMDEEFYGKLYASKKKKQSGLSGINFNEIIHKHQTVWRVAAGITLFIIGWFGGVRFSHLPHSNSQYISLQNEMNDMKKMVMLTMMEKQSPTERIKAVHMVEQLPDIDSKIIHALLKTLNEDVNDNVRLVALETLKQYANYAEVREGLILSIATQESPLLQLALAEVMVELQEKRAVPHFKEMLQDQSLNYTVRNKVNESLKTLI